MRRDESQSGSVFPRALRLANDATPVLPTVNPAYRFSDASIHTHDPRHLIAKMTLTRIQCRTKGLIRRDTTELIAIGQRLGITPADTRQIIVLVQELPEGASILDLLTDDLLQISIKPIDDQHKKTRVQPRVLIGLSIWAVTIVIAMMTV